MIRRIAILPRDAFHLGLMLALTFSTGVIDAVGYLGLDRVFSGNMTGNVVVLGMALAGGDNLPVLGPALALVGFMAGAAIGGRVLKGSDGGWDRRSTVMFGGVALVMLVLSVVLFVAGDDFSRTLRVCISTTLAIAMGAQAAAARVVAVKDIPTVVVTSTITGLAADSVLGSGKGGGSGRRASAVVLILAGAAAGAGLLQWHLGASLVLSAAITGVVAVLGAIHSTHHSAAASVSP